MKLTGILFGLVASLSFSLAEVSSTPLHCGSCEPKKEKCADKKDCKDKEDCDSKKDCDKKEDCDKEKKCCGDCQDKKA